MCQTRSMRHKCFKQRWCLSAGECINKLQYIHTMKYHRATKIKTVIQATIWNELMDSKLNEINLTPKVKI